MKKNKLLMGIVLLTVILIAVVVFMKMKSPHEEEESNVTTEVAVRVGKIERATLHSYVVAYGTIEPEPAGNGKSSASARIASPVAGVVAEVNCMEGQNVEKGTLLLTMDDHFASIRMEEIQQVLKFTQQNYERQKKMLQTGGASSRQVAEAELQLNKAQQDLESAEAQLKIKSPINGIVARISVNPGEAVDINKVLAEIVDPNRLIVTASIPSGEASSLKTGEMLEFMNGKSTKPIKGSLSFVSPQVDSKTDTVLVRSSVPPDSGFRSGQFVQIRIINDEHPNCMAVPIESVVSNPENGSIISIVEGDKATQKAVKVGLRDGNLIEIEGEGLKEGMAVVTTGAYGLPKETKIRVANQ